VSRSEGGGGGVFDETRPKLHLELLERMKRRCFGVITGPVASASLGKAMHRSVNTRKNTDPFFFPCVFDRLSLGIFSRTRCDA
jgi:hypothetical protein